MLRIKAFQGLRPPPVLAAEVSCVPYDVVDRQEAAALAAGKPNSLLHVDRAEIDLPASADPHAPEVYATALESFIKLQKRGALLREREPCVYLYQQRMGEHVQTGLAAVCHIEDYENNLIKKHEKTRPDKEDDRARLIATLSADTGPVFLTYRDQPAVEALVAPALGTEPLYDFAAPDGVQHTVWRIPGGQAFREAFAAVPAAYVADGHHRTASAVRVGRERRVANAHHTGDEDYNWFLAVLFPASHLRILPYNRAIKDLGALTKDAFLDAVHRSFSVEPDTSPVPSAPGEICMYLNRRWHRLTRPPSPCADPISRLDVTVLQEKIFAGILGITDPRTSTRLDFIGGIRGTDELARRVDNGQSAVAFSMYPTTVEQLMAIADAGEIMPPKSTWFEPKLRSGLFIHTL